MIRPPTASNPRPPSSPAAPARIAAAAVPSMLARPKSENIRVIETSAVSFSITGTTIASVPNFKLVKSKVFGYPIYLEGLDVNMTITAASGVIAVAVVEENINPAQAISLDDYANLLSYSVAKAPPNPALIQSVGRSSSRVFEQIYIPAGKAIAIIASSPNDPSNTADGVINLRYRRA